MGFMSRLNTELAEKLMDELGRYPTEEELADAYQDWVAEQEYRWESVRELHYDHEVEVEMAKCKK